MSLDCVLNHCIDKIKYFGDLIRKFLNKLESTEIYVSNKVILSFNPITIKILSHLCNYGVYRGLKSAGAVPQVRSLNKLSNVL